MAFVLFHDAVVNNDAYTNVLYTGKQTQFVAKALKPDMNIGMESHKDTSQTVIVIDGKGLARMGDDREPLHSGKTIQVEPGTDHDFIADRNSWLRILVIYSPPLHPPNEYVMEKPSTTQPSTPQPAILQEEEQESVALTYGVEDSSEEPPTAVPEEEEEESV